MSLFLPESVQYQADDAVINEEFDRIVKSVGTYTSEDTSEESFTTLFTLLFFKVI
ncbi:MAG: hypothetical protein V9G25_03120 [Acidimicrobiia bacterium]